MKLNSAKKKQRKIPSKFSEDVDDDGEDEITNKWYEEFPNDPEETAELLEEEINKLRSEAKLHYQNELTKQSNKSSKNSRDSNLGWMKTMTSKGTTSDKIAANTLLIQSAPLHNLATLNNFIGMLKLGKKDSLMVIQTLSELFLSDLLPPDRKLRVFAACPLSQLGTMSSGNQLTRVRHLVRWYFEDQLKEAYHEFLVHLNTAARDSIEANKEKAIMAMYKLLAGNPEKEAFILTNMVNKLGDPSQKVASKTIYCLTQLLRKHPAMKSVVMEEIEKLLFRANISPKAQYYGICFLSQFYYSSYDGEVARNVIRIYFSFFKSCVKQGTVDTRMMRILLNGVNRAFPFVSKENSEEVSQHIDMLYKIVHVANYNVSLHALSLVYQVADLSCSITDRFYSALYKKLADPALATSSHHAMFLSLVFRALKKNDSLSRGRAFIKRMLQTCKMMPVPVVCGILFLVSQLIRGNRDLLALTVQYDKFEDDDEEECYKDVKLDDEEPEATETPDVKPDLPKASWFHAANSKPAGGSGGSEQTKRNPQFAGGEHCAFTELTKLSQHFHPTIRLFANNILAGETIFYSGDPLQDFTLIRFLDRFVFKNPKKLSAMPESAVSPFDRKKSYSARGLRSLAVNSNQYLNETVEKIPADELFMYSFLHERRAQGKNVNQEDADSDADSVTSEDFDKMMDGLMGSKGDDELDYADEVGDKLTATDKGRGPKKAADSDGEDDNDEEEESEQDDSELEGEDDDGEMDEEDDYGEDDIDDDDDDDEGIVFGSDGEDFELGDDFDINNISDEDGDDIKPMPMKKGSTKKELLAKYSRPNASIFASADEFAEMLEESGASTLKVAGSSAMANKDNAAEKQMKWEVKRNDWMTDDKWKNKNGKRKSFSANKGGAKKSRRF